MGGSTLGMLLVKSAFDRELPVPLEIVNNYHVGDLVTKNTLVIASSYSGNTEEVLSAVEEAKKRQAKIVTISSGGALTDWALKNSFPAFIYTTNNNPCRSPRMGLGSSVFGSLILLSKAGLIKVSEPELGRAVEVIKKFSFEFGTTVIGEANFAKKLANDLYDKTVWFVSSEHLLHSAHVAANQMNETAKRFAGYFAIPELNHHLLEGMMYPKSNKNDLAFVFLESKLYDTRVQKRFVVTKEILKKNDIKFFSYQCESQSKLSQVCELLTLSSYLSFYSAMLEGIDPTTIPYVDYFKEQLKG
jgi:glucose/mannose-6-phosphate isomerase